MSTCLESPLPSHYRSRQAFLASLPPWRRLLSKLNWHPTIDKKVEQYRLEQRLLQLKNENAREAELNARIASLWPSSSSSSTPTPPTADDSPI